MMEAASSLRKKTVRAPSSSTVTNFFLWAVRPASPPGIGSVNSNGDLFPLILSRKNLRRSSYSRYRFPPEIVSQAVSLYHRFALSFTDVEDMLAERGVIVAYESIDSNA